ncbi:hypothetical protein C1646_755050 [Rhizophagus diaphanus]|nr:hypothetical protein C1646_755050 [Rhizophagus diaphanus] [Rhizophagus sp. MUCL 43196]
MANTNNEKDIPVIIIVRRTGSGKSTLANVLLGEEKFAEVPGSSSGTKNIQSENFRWNGKHYRASPYITIVCSNFVEFKDRGKCEADIKKLLKENKSIAGVIKGCKVIHVDNPSLQYNNAREIRQCSREKLLNYLDEIASEKPNTEDIDVDKIIKELEN